MRHRTSFITIMTTVAASLVLAAGVGADDLSWHTVDGGGGESSGGDFTCHGTAGQADAGAAMTGGDFVLVGGFWAGAGTPPPECRGDVDGDGTVGFSDLVAVLAAWGVCADCPEDVDGDGSVDFSDLLFVLGNWGPC